MPSPGGVRFTAILSDHVPRALSADKKFKTQLRNTLRRQGTAMKQQLESTTKTWRRNVKFKITTSLRVNDDVLGYTVTTDNPVWGFLDQGTDYRSRRMTPDYVPKTQSGVFDSFAGAGGVAGHARMPGIEGRLWSEKLQDISNFLTPILVEQLMENFAKEANG